jgi:predicted RNA-binding protein with RPS1 domain
LEEEKNIDNDILKSAFLERKIEFVKDIPENYNIDEKIDIEIVNEVESNEILIDIRNPEEIKKSPFVLN